MTFTALTRIQHDGATYEPGDAIAFGALTEAQQSHLLLSGSIALAPEPAGDTPDTPPRMAGEVGDTPSPSPAARPRRGKE